MMVMEPPSRMGIIVRDATSFPEILESRVDLHGLVTEFLTGCGIAFDADGFMRISLFISSRVVSPSNPPGFTN